MYSSKYNIFWNDGHGPWQKKNSEKYFGWAYNIKIKKGDFKKLFTYLDPKNPSYIPHILPGVYQKMISENHS